MENLPPRAERREYGDAVVNNSSEGRCVSRSSTHHLALFAWPNTDGVDKPRIPSTNIRFCLTEIAQSIVTGISVSLRVLCGIFPDTGMDSA